MKKMKSSKNNNHEEKEEKMEKNGKKGVTIAIMVGMPKRGARTATSKAKKKK